jgi:hypothetical protein
MHIHSRALLALILGFSASANAATFCVANSSQLQQALTTSETNADPDNSILVQPGTYSTSSGSTAFVYSGPESKPLDIIGGYVTVGGTPCALISYKARLTVLSGSGVRQVLNLTGGAMRVFNMTIKDGHATVPGAGLSMAALGENSLVVGLMIFDNNVSEASGGGLSMSESGSTAAIIGNLFTNNRCATNGCAMNGVFSAVDPSVHYVSFGGNTVASNSCSNGAPGTCTTGGVKFSGSARSIIYNNAFALNGGLDLDLQGANGSLYNSNVPSKAGTFTPNSGNLALANPGFVDPADKDYRLRYDSPLRNVGTSSYFMQNYDLDGNGRFNVPLDMGAYERPEDQFFFDNFESGY